MKLLFLSTFLLISLAGCAQNKQPPKSNSNPTAMNDTFTTQEQEIIDVTDHLTILMIAKDLKGLNNLLDQDFTLTHITGYVQPKSEWLKEIESERMKYYSFQPTKRKVEINGNKAKVIQQNILDARIWGTRNNWHLQQIFQLEKQNGKWIILSSVASTF